MNKHEPFPMSEVHTDLKTTVGVEAAERNQAVYRSFRRMGDSHTVTGMRQRV